MNNNKGQGISVQTLVIATLSLVVLIILIAIFSGKINVFNKNTATCESKGGKCASELDNHCTKDYPIKIYSSDCKCIKENCGDDDPGACCIKIGK